MARPADRQPPPLHGPSIPRRTVLTSALAGAALSCVPDAIFPAHAAVVPSDAANRRFSILRGSDRIGTHTVARSAATGETRITTAIDLVVKILFFTAYALRHRSEETWRDGRLASLRSETVEDGETVHVLGTQTPQGFEVITNGIPFIAAAGTLTSNNLWTPVVLEQATVIDAQHGGIIGVSMRKLAGERILVAGRQVGTTRYRLITPYLAGSIWYDETGQWMHAEFERDAEHIVYRLEA
jgi:hypothetical protein